MAQLNDNPIRVGLLGAGTVGSQTARLLVEQKDELAARIGRPIELVGVACLDPDEVDFPWIDKSLLTTDTMKVATNADIVVELIGGTTVARTFVMAAIESGASVVTANKALIAAYYRELTGLAKEKGVALRCTGAECPAQLVRNLVHFASRDCMDIEGLGPAVVRALVENDLIRTPGDLYHLNAQDVAKLDRMGEKSAENLIAAIEKSKQQDLSRLISAFGIRQVGTRGAQVLAERFRHLRLSVGPGQEALERQLLRQLGLTTGGGAAAVTVTFGPQAREGCAVYLTPDCARRQRVDYIWRDGESPAPEEPLLAALHRAGRLPDVGVKSAETLDIGP